MRSRLIAVQLASSFSLLASHFFSLAAGCSLFALQCSLFAVQSFLLACHTLFLAARNYLFDVCCPLPVVRFSLLNYFFSRCFLLAAWFLFLVACCSPLANFCFKFAVRLLCSSLLSLLATDRLRFICVSRCLLITFAAR